MRQKISVSWSGGKDSAMALYYVLNNPKYEVVSLHTVFDADTKRVGMHGVHQSLISAQAGQVGIALDKIYLPGSTNHSTYEEVITSYCEGLKKRGVTKIVYGDIFLEDLKNYRIRQLAKVGMEAIFPLWGRNTSELLATFWRLKFKTILCAGKATLFEEDKIGTELNEALVKSLPEEVDPCGENGEFHSFLIDAPYFNEPIKVQQRESVYREYDAPNAKAEKVGFWFRELILKIE